MNPCKVTEKRLNKTNRKGYILIGSFKSFIEPKL